MSEAEYVERERLNILEILDQLIHHVQGERLWFSFVCLASLIVSPISIGVTVYVLLHPNLVRWVYKLGNFIGTVFLLYLAGNILIATLWLVIALKEYQFLRKWSERFQKYRELMQKVDRELEPNQY